MVNMMDGLAFLPLDEAEEGMEHLKAVMPQDPPEVEDLLTYFDRTWFFLTDSAASRQTRCSAQFALWSTNVHSSPVELS